MENYVFNKENIEKAAELLKAVSQPLRFKILNVINEKKEVNVNVIYNTLKIEQSIISQHLKMLREVEAVITRRDGKKIYYTINYDKLNTMQQGIRSFGGMAETAPKKKKT